MLLFNLKKLIGALLMPLPTLLLLLLFSLHPVADRLLRPIESEYQTYRGHDPVNYIVVLG